MAINYVNLEATGTRWNAPSDDYPQGSYKNGSGKGERDGSYMTANAMNDVLGFIGAILKAQNVTLSGYVETANNSQTYNALKEIIKADSIQYGGTPVAIAGGSSDAITATFTNVTALSNGVHVLVRSVFSNTTTTPTLNVNGLGAKSICKNGNTDLSTGDILGNGMWLDLLYDATYDKWVLQNPVSGAYNYIAEDVLNTALEELCTEMGV